MNDAPKTSRQARRHDNKNPRALAITALSRFWRDLAPIGDFAAENGLAAADRRLTMNIIYGVLRHRQFLQAVTIDVCRHSFDRLDATLREALAVGLYQLFFLDRIPQPVAVNETVAAAKRLGLAPHLVGVLNGSLRSVIRRRNTLTNANDFLNHPDWLTERWRHRFGEAEMRRICAANNRQPPLALRVNTRRCAADRLQTMLTVAGIAAHPGHYAENAIILPDYQGAITQLPGFTEGLFHIQDEAAQLACSLLGGSEENLRILDACAGLGGKTATIAQLFPKADIEAVEPDTGRSRLFAQNSRRLGFQATLFTGRLDSYGRGKKQFFDRIVVDAPCSGLGICGRHPEIRWGRRENELPRYQNEQLALLTRAYALLAPDGLLVYATCSLENEETFQVIRRFLALTPDMIAEDCRPFLPSPAHGMVVDGFLQSRPSQNLDGFFSARLKRRQ